MNVSHPDEVMEQRGWGDRDRIRADRRLDRGIEVAQLLLERFGVPSIFLSGIGDDQTIERALTVSSLGFLQKPFLPSQVFDVIDRALTDILPLSR